MATSSSHNKSEALMSEAYRRLLANHGSSHQQALQEGTSVPDDAYITYARKYGSGLVASSPAGVAQVHASHKGNLGTEQNHRARAAVNSSAHVLSLGTPQQRRPPILVQHGLLASCACFALSGKDVALAFLLADLGGEKRGVPRGGLATGLHYEGCRSQPSTHNLGISCTYPAQPG
jgi:hypothetical protein